MGREELTRSSETDALQRSAGKVWHCQFDGEPVTIRIARNLTQQYITATGCSQHKRRSKLGPGQVRKRKTNEDYGPG